MQRWLFYVCLQGVGADTDTAWRDACEQFALDPGPTPEREMTVKTFNRLVRAGLRTPSVYRQIADEED